MTAPTTNVWARRGRTLLPVFGASLAAVGHGGAVMVVVWTLSMWAVRSSDRARLASGALPFVVALVGAVAAALPGGLAGASGLATVSATYVALALVGWVLTLSLNAQEERDRRGLVGIALVWLLAPTVPGLLGLLMVGLSFGLETQRGVRSPDARPAARRLAAGLGIVMLLVALLPLPATPGLPGVLRGWLGESLSSSAPSAPSTGADGTAAPPRTRPIPPGGEASVPRTRLAVESAAPAWAVALLDRLPFVLLLLMAAALGVFLVQSARLAGRLGRGDRPHWSDVVVPTALLVGLVLGAVFLLLLRRGGAGGEGGRAAPESAPGAGAQGAEQLVSATPLFWGLFGLGLAAMLLLAVGLLLVIVVTLRQRAESRDDPDPEPAEGDSARPDLPVHRVRAAYRRVLAALSAAGVGRHEHETPGELARRTHDLVPDVAADVQRVTLLYQPVRYGARVTEQGAEDAEQAAERVERTLRERVAAPSPALSHLGPTGPSTGPSKETS